MVGFLTIHYYIFINDYRSTKYSMRKTSVVHQQGSKIGQTMHEAGAYPTRPPLILTQKRFLISSYT